MSLPIIALRWELLFLFLALFNHGTGQFRKSFSQKICTGQVGVGFISNKDIFQIMERKNFIYDPLCADYSEYIMNPTTIQLDSSTVAELRKIKEYPRQTYDELIRKMALLFQYAKKRNQYDEFLHKIQQPKMKELWDNKEDEAWENA